MANWRIWPSTNGPGSDAGDANSYSLSVEFEVTQTGCTLTGFYYWAATGSDLTHNISCTLWSCSTGTTGTQITAANATLAQPLTANAWNFVACTPTALTSGQHYRAEVTYSGGFAWYSATAAGLPSNIVNGPLTCFSTANAEGTNQCGFITGSSPAYTTGTGSDNYWIDVRVNDNAGLPNPGGTSPLPPAYYPGAGPGAPGGVPFTPWPQYDPATIQPIPIVNAQAGLATGTGAAKQAVGGTDPYPASYTSLYGGPETPPSGGSFYPPAATYQPGLLPGMPGGEPFTPWPQYVPGALGPVSASASAAVATGTGTAQQPLAAAGANAVAAAGTGSAQPAVAATGASAVVATGTGTAQPAVAAITVNAVVATGTGAALSATVSTSGSTNALAGLAAGTGAAQPPVAAVGANAAVATGTGTAQQATVSTSSNTNALAGLAAGTGTAQPARIAIAAGTRVATAIGAALGPEPQLANATSKPTVTQKNTGVASVTQRVTGAPAVSQHATSTATVSGG